MIAMVFRGICVFYINHNIVNQREQAEAHGHIQHHPLLHGEVPVLQLPQRANLPGLQLRHEAQTAHIDPQHGCHG